MCIRDRPTPCRSGVTALSAFFPVTFASTPFGSTTYQFADGAMTTVAGITAWVATQPEAAYATAAYRVLYLDAGNVYTGLWVRDGTVLRQFQLGSHTPQNDHIVLDAAAMVSISTAVSF